MRKGTQVIAVICYADQEQLALLKDGPAQCGMKNSINLGAQDVDGCRSSQKNSLIGIKLSGTSNRPRQIKVKEDK